MIYIVSTTETERDLIEKFLEDIETDVRDYNEEGIIKEIENIGYIAPFTGNNICTVFDPTCDYLNR